MVTFTLFAPFFLVALVEASPSLFKSHSLSRFSLGAYVPTTIGIARGTTPIDGTSRFAVKYASAQRWQNAVVADAWELPYASSIAPVDNFH
jgi:hypothetical protein